MTLKKTELLRLNTSNILVSYLKRKAFAVEAFTTLSMFNVGFLQMFYHVKSSFYF